MRRLPPKKESEIPRRSFLRTVTQLSAASFIPLQLLDWKLQKSTIFLEERKAKETEKPLRHVSAIDTLPDDLLHTLLKNGYQGIILGDGNHHSRPVQNKMAIMAMQFPSFDGLWFAEQPEAGKENPGDYVIHERAAAYDGVYKKEESARPVVKPVDEKVVDENAIWPWPASSEINVDTRQGPDHQTRLIAINASLGYQPQYALKELCAESILRGSDNDLIYRNHHMADKIAETMQMPKHKNKPFIFKVGRAHVHGYSKDDIQELLHTSLPDKKIAVIHVIGVKDENMNNRLYRDRSDNNTFFVTVYDKHFGHEVDKHGTINTYEGEYIMTGRVRQQPKAEHVR